MFIVLGSLLSGDNMGTIRLFDLRVLDDRSNCRRETISSNPANNPEYAHFSVVIPQMPPQDDHLAVVVSARCGSLHLLRCR